MGTDEVHALKVQLATALRAMEAWKAAAFREKDLLNMVEADLAALRAAPCPGCVCADTEHRYCPVCADAIQDIQAERDRLLSENERLETALRGYIICHEAALHRAEAAEEQIHARAALGGSNA